MRKTVHGKSVIICLLITAVCISLNFLAPLVDNQALREHAAEAVDSVWNAGSSQQIIGGFENARLDDYTAVLIVKTACFTGNVPFLDKVFGGLRVEQAVREDTDEWGAYCTYVSDDMIQKDDIIHSYTRYWHGYMLPLRLAMSFMSYSNVRMLCYMLVMILFTGIIILAYQNRNTRKALPAFLLTFFLMMPAAMGTCLNFIPCILISLSVSVTVLRYGRVMKNTYWLFCGSGIVTAFMDLLTFPLITLVFPLTFWLCMLLEKEDNAICVFKTAIVSALCWGMGFAGMWALKWGINWILYGPEAIQGVFQQILLRSSTNADGTVMSRLEGMLVNLKIILDKPVYRLALGAYLAGQVFVFVKGQKGPIRLPVFSLLIPVLISVAWIIATTNHVVIHSYYVYRTLWVSLFPLLSVFALLSNARHRMKPENC